MLNLLYIICAVLILSLIVTVHEFGHFIVGKLSGIAVEEFSIGMGPRLFGHKGKKTLFSVRAIPLGGYCRFKGEDEDDTSPDAMNNQPVWKRFLTVLSGPLMNFVFAYILCVIMLDAYVYREYIPQAYSVSEGSPACEAGLLAGDVITSINGVEITCDQAGCDRLTGIIGESADSVLDITVRRESGSVSLSITPAPVVDENTGKTVYQIGITLNGRTYTFFEAIGNGFSYMFECLGLMLRSLKDLFLHGTGIEDTMGPVGIISFVSEYVREGLYTALYLAFIISLNLGLMNLLPLPALDGGRLVFLAVEGIRRKPIPRDKEGLVHGIGFILLIGVIIFFTYKDIVRIVTG